MPNTTDPNAKMNGLSGLLLLAKEGDEEAFAELVRLYSPLLEAAVAPHRASLQIEDLEELMQEALVAFHRAIGSYEIFNGDVSFGLYAKICVGKAVISALRHFNTRKNRSVISLDEIPYVDLVVSDDPSSAVIERESAAELRRTIRRNLSKYENAVWWMYYSGMSADEIAEDLGTSKKSVSNALTRIRKKLRELFSGSAN